VSYDIQTFLLVTSFLGHCISCHSGCLVTWAAQKKQVWSFRAQCSRALCAAFCCLPSSRDSYLFFHPGDIKLCLSAWQATPGDEPSCLVLFVTVICQLG